MHESSGMSIAGREGSEQPNFAPPPPGIYAQWHSLHVRGPMHDLALWDTLPDGFYEYLTQHFGNETRFPDARSMP